MKHSCTIRVEDYVRHTPGNLSHMKALMESYLKGKGIQTKQEWVNGKPVHSVVFNVETVDNVVEYPGDN